MMDKIKAILLKQISDDIDAYNDAQTRLEDIDQSINGIMGITPFGQNQSLPINNSVEFFLARKIPRKPMISSNNYSFLGKHVFHRKAYLEQEKRNRKLEEDYEKACSDYGDLCKKLRGLVSERERLVIFCQQKEEVRKRYDLIKTAKSLKDLGMSLDDVIELFNKNNLKFVLNESDLTVISNESDFDKKSDYVMIHKTKYIPSNDKIFSPRGCGAKKKIIIPMDDYVFEYEYLEGRNTVHFYLNSEVISHFNGNHDGRKYAVVLPFDVVDRTESKLASFTSADSFFDGNVDTCGGYILCPEEEVDEIQKTNPNTTVVGYRGKNVDGFANYFISLLGYKKVDGDKNGWVDSELESQFSQFCWKNGLNGGEYHAGSKYEKRDSLLKYYYHIFGFIDGLKTLVNTVENFDVKKFVLQYFNRPNGVSYKYGKSQGHFKTKVGPESDSFIGLCDFFDYASQSDELVKSIKDNFFRQESLVNRNILFLISKLKEIENISIPQDVIISMTNTSLDKIYNDYPEVKSIIVSIFGEDNKLTDRDVINVYFIYKIVESVYTNRHVLTNTDTSSYT